MLANECMVGRIEPALGNQKLIAEWLTPQSGCQLQCILDYTEECVWMQVYGLVS